ncbi:MAG: hypothetical protein CR986_03235 [Ignavibacteriae bacterium]|nr:MAG: hypothetical protein CR986_03235 [Ignavibacteriota bacterium]
MCRTSKKNKIPNLTASILSPSNLIIPHSLLNSGFDYSKSYKQKNKIKSYSNNNEVTNEEK